MINNNKMIIISQLYIGFPLTVYLFLYGNIDTESI